MQFAKGRTRVGKKAPFSQGGIIPPHDLMGNLAFLKNVSV